MLILHLYVRLLILIHKQHIRCSSVNAACFIFFPKPDAASIQVKSARMNEKMQLNKCISA